MSLGYGWSASLVLNDGDTAVYSYHTYDLSLPHQNNGYGSTEDDGEIWVFIADNGELEVVLEKASKYCSGKGSYSAKHLFLRCAHKIQDLYQAQGAFPQKVVGDI